MKAPTVLHLFAGLGGGALGFKRAGFVGVGVFDNDEAACRDFERIVGEKAHQVDLGTIEPHELRALCTGRPDVVFTSPPCKSFSGCLPEKFARTDKYKAMSSLAEKGIWLALEAFDDDPPSLFVMENVPRITGKRGRQWLDRVVKMLQAKGYSVNETTHDCGELGGLGQRRRRFLLVARHMTKVPAFVYEPPKKRHRTVGDVIGQLPVPLPGSTEGGPLHRLPSLAAMTWLRLALIPAGGDWRDLEHMEGVRVPYREARQNGGWGVNDAGLPSHTVMASHDIANTWGSVADPRVTCDRQDGSLGVTPFDGVSTTIIGHATPHNGPWQVADPRLTYRGDPSHDNDARHKGKLGVEAFDQPSHTVMACASPHLGRAAVVADPRLNCDAFRGVYGVAASDETMGTVTGSTTQMNGRFAVADPRVGGAGPWGGTYGVVELDDQVGAIIANARPDTGSFAVADVRIGYPKPPRRGTMRVERWAEPTHCIIGDARTNKGQNVADPRMPELIGPPLDFDDTKTLMQLVIRAADGTWHRPLTTLELMALQGLPLRDADGNWIDLDGNSDRAKRQRIGNAVPPPAAEAIAKAFRRALEAAEFYLDGCKTPVWVDRAEEVCAS